MMSAQPAENDGVRSPTTGLSAIDMQTVLLNVFCGWITR
jgi:hypothetical protein